MAEKLVIGFFYKKVLNLYGDNGNVEILVARAKARGFDTEVLEVEVETNLDKETMNKINLVFMGGGPDSSQKSMYEDLINQKGKFLKDYIEKGGVGLYVCGSYQLLGKYYKSADGSMLKGLEVFDFYTQHFGNQRKRCIGNTVARLSNRLLEDPVFKSINKVGNTVVGFENHGGRTFLGVGVTPFSTVIKGNGNNSVDKTEGILYKNTIGTYFHGPVLARNPHLADYLLAKALKVYTIRELDDSLIISAHTASLKLKQ